MATGCASERGWGWVRQSGAGPGRGTTNNRRVTFLLPLRVARRPVGMAANGHFSQLPLGGASVASCGRGACVVAFVVECTTRQGLPSPVGSLHLSFSMTFITPAGRWGVQVASTVWRLSGRSHG